MAGHWKVGQVKITGTKVPLFIFSFIRTKEISLRERMGPDPKDYATSPIRVMVTMVKSTWSEKPQRKHSITAGISWAPCNEIVWGLLQRGPRMAVLLVYVDYFLFLLFFSPPKFVDVSSYLCVRGTLKPGEQNSRLGKEKKKSVLKTFIPEGRLLGGGEIASG